MEEKLPPKKSIQKVVEKKLPPRQSLQFGTEDVQIKPEIVAKKQVKQHLPKEEKKLPEFNFATENVEPIMPKEEKRPEKPKRKEKVEQNMTFTTDDVEFKPENVPEAKVEKKKQKIKEKSLTEFRFSTKDEMEEKLSPKKPTQKVVVEKKLPPRQSLQFGTEDVQIKPEIMAKKQVKQHLPKEEKKLPELNFATENVEPIMPKEEKRPEKPKRKEKVEQNMTFTTDDVEFKPENVPEAKVEKKKQKIKEKSLPEFNDDHSF
uniref:Uncharacterized protein n=1 Tax=Panagrolaimus sp. JU765 TaxID=591449 RepID=A0AC34Q3D0_9BILA